MIRFGLLLWTCPPLGPTSRRGREIRIHNSIIWIRGRNNRILREKLHSSCPNQNKHSGSHIDQTSRYSDRSRWDLQVYMAPYALVPVKSFCRIQTMGRLTVIGPENWCFKIWIHESTEHSFERGFQSGNSWAMTPRYRHRWRLLVGQVRGGAHCWSGRSMAPHDPSTLPTSNNHRWGLRASTFSYPPNELSSRVLKPQRSFCFFISETDFPYTNIFAPTN